MNVKIALKLQKIKRLKENNLEYILNILKMEKTGKIRKKEKNFEKVSTKKSDLELSLRELKSLTK